MTQAIHRIFVQDDLKQQHFHIRFFYVYLKGLKGKVHTELVYIYFIYYNNMQIPHFYQQDQSGRKHGAHYTCPALTLLVEMVETENLVLRILAYQ